MLIFPHIFLQTEYGRISHTAVKVAVIGSLDQYFCGAFGREGDSLYSGFSLSIVRIAHDCKQRVVDIQSVGGEDFRQIQRIHPAFFGQFDTQSVGCFPIGGLFFISHGKIVVLSYGNEFHRYVGESLFKVVRGEAGLGIELPLIGKIKQVIL